MKITVIGGGPGGLYFSILVKKANPQAQIDVYERNKSDDSFGFGVVFSDETLSSHDAIEMSVASGMGRKKRKEMEDAFAASIMLQNYIDSKTNVNLQ